jgi:transposase
LGVGFPRQRHGEGAKRGELTGPNPTDRAKLGCKRHVLTDGRGVPLAVTLTGANVHDKWMVGATLDAVLVRAPRGPRRPVNLCLDKGYDYADPDDEARARGVVPHIRRRGEKPLIGCVRGRPRRWVVERTNSWHNNFRALRIRWERKALHYGALVHLASALVAFRAATRRKGHRF